MHFMKAWMAIGLAFVALVIFLSLTSNPVQVPDVGFKLGHVLAYAWLMFWFAQLFRGRPTRLAIGVALALMGVALEYIQGMTGYRTFAYSDMRDNAVGVVAGFLVALTPMGRLIPSMDRLIAQRA
jgi:hypothetical protein